MITKEEFTENLKVAVAMSLPPSFGNAVMEVQHVTGFNDTGYDALTIRQPDSPISPSINIDQMYEDYNNGRSLPSIAQEIVQIKMKDSFVLENIDVGNIYDYEMIKENIFIRLCDKDLNQEHLDGLVTGEFGDLTATYRVNVGRGDEAILSTAVTQDLLAMWDISPAQLHHDALANSSPKVFSITDMMEGMMFGMEPTNLLERGIPLTEEEIYRDMPLFVITNESQINGASVIIDPEIMKQVCTICGGDGFVLPSSIHEALFVPDNGSLDVSELTAMVQMVNQEEVAPRDILSNKVQYCDKETGRLMNAELREQQILQKQQEMAQQAEQQKKTPPQAKGPSF